MRIRIIGLIVLVSFTVKVYSQRNLVRNSSFDQGVDCKCHSRESNSNPYLGLDYWEQLGPLVQGDMPTPDWYEFPFCFTNGPFQNVILGMKYEYLPELLYSHTLLGIGNWTETGKTKKEGIRIELIENLKPNTTYLVKLKIGCGKHTFQNLTGNGQINLSFSKWGEHWNTDPSFSGNVLWDGTLKFLPQGSGSVNLNEFKAHQFSFTTPLTLNNKSTSELKYLILYNETDNSYYYIDDVELYEVSESNCNANWFIENKSYEYHELPIETSGTITAGRNVLDNNSNGPVLCDAKQDSAFGDSRVIYKAGKRIQLKDGFKVEKEAYFRAYLAPCGKEFFDPVADLGITDSVITICGDVERCLDLGTRKAYNMTYEWSSNDAAISALLTGIGTMSQIKLCIPRNVPSGTYRLTYKVTNKSGTVDEKNLRIYINRSPFNSNPVMYHMSGITTWGGYYFNGSKSHIHFWANYRVYYCDEVYMEVINENGELIDTKTFLIDRDYPRSVGTVTPKLEVEYYKDLSCGNYKFKFTMINKCNGDKAEYIENTRYNCQFD